MSSTKRLGPGESLNRGVPIGDYVALTQPGEYRIQLRYHDEDDIDTATDLAGRFVSSSEPFSVRTLPRHIELTQARLDEMRGWIRKLDTHPPVVLVSGHWHPGMIFSGQPSDPKDRLFHAGWDALPALLDAMADPATEPERRAWVFGMLWNILGVENPGKYPRVGAMGEISWEQKWPSSTEQGQMRFGEFGNFSPTPIDPKAQQELAAAWNRWRPLIDVKIVP